MSELQIGTRVQIKHKKFKEWLKGYSTAAKIMVDAGGLPKGATGVVVMLDYANDRPLIQWDKEYAGTYTAIGNVTRAHTAPTDCLKII